MKHLTVKLFVLLAAILLAWNVQAQEQTVEAKGVGLGRNEALQDALRNAVSQAMGTHVRSESRLENFVLISDAVSTVTKGYVTRYDVVNERQTGNTQEVTVRATVSLSALQADAQTLAQMIGGLRFLTIYDPRKANTASIDGYEFAVERINEFLADKNYRYIEKSRFDALKNEAFRLFKNDTSEATFVQRLGLMADAQFIIYISDINVRQERSNIGTTRTKVLISAKAYDNCTAEGLGTIVMESNWQNLTDPGAALRLAVSNGVEQGMDRLLFLFNQYMGSWVNNGAPFEVRIYEAGTFRDIRDVRNRLRNDPAFGGQMEPTSVNNFTKLVMTFKKKPEELADRMLDIFDEVPFYKEKRMDVKLMYGRQLSFAPHNVIVPEAKEKGIVEEMPLPKPDNTDSQPRTMPAPTPAPLPTLNKTAPAKTTPAKKTPTKKTPAKKTSSTTKR